MKTEKELNAKIMELTNKIREERPELIKYIDEMPITIPSDSDPEISQKVLKDYIISLKDLLKKTHWIIPDEQQDKKTTDNHTHGSGGYCFVLLPGGIPVA